MRKFVKRVVADAKRTKPLKILLLTVASILFVYFVTTSINAISYAIPADCENASIGLKSICSADESYSSKLNLEVENRLAGVNGFKIVVYGMKDYKSVLLFKTLMPQETDILEISYDKEVLGDISKVEIEPLLNFNRNVYYCGITSGITYKHPVGNC